MTTSRYARHEALPEIGQEGQERIGKGRVLIVGLGGLGCSAAQYLAGSGVGTLILNDFDRVDETNLSRQILYDSRDVGELKVDAARKRLNLMNPDIRIRCLSERLSPATLLSHIEAVSIVLDGTDNFATRLAVNHAAVKARVPLVTGAAVRFEGQLSVFLNTGTGPCYRCLYCDEDEWLGNCQGTGVVAPVPGVIGTLMAMEALKLLLGLDSALHHRLHLWDGKRGEWRDVALKTDPECLDCQA